MQDLGTTKPQSESESEHAPAAEPKPPIGKLDQGVLGGVVADAAAIPARTATGRFVDGAGAARHHKWYSALLVVTHIVNSMLETVRRLPTERDAAEAAFKYDFHTADINPRSPIWKVT